MVGNDLILQVSVHVQTKTCQLTFQMHTWSNTQRSEIFMARRVWVSNYNTVDAMVGTIGGLFKSSLAALNVLATSWTDIQQVNVSNLNRLTIDPSNTTKPSSG